jgi:ElaB/YqjD/DUF883 family membrane-anchored ribosome-binding protein
LQVAEPPEPLFDRAIGGGVPTGGRRAEEALRQVRVPSPERRIRDYPVTTVLAAAALGLFTGFLLSRR